MARMLSARASDRANRATSRANRASRGAIHAPAESPGTFDGLAPDELEKNWLGWGAAHYAAR